MPEDGRLEVTLHIFETLALGVGEWPAVCSVCFTPVVNKNTAAISM